MQFSRSLIPVLLSILCASAQAYDATSSRGADLTGYWRLNAAASDDAEKLLQARLEEERLEHQRWVDKERKRRGMDGPPMGSPEDAVAPPPRTRSPRNRRDDPLRSMLAITKALQIAQSGADVTIVSDQGSRQLAAGTKSQVSMPEGELADSTSGWDGEWFVIDRRVRKGPRVIEKYRVLKKTGQLEWQLAIGGDHVLSGIRARRVFDRADAPAPAPGPEAGPVR